MSPNIHCPLCPTHALDPLGHHRLTCKSGGDVVSWHNRLQDYLVIHAGKPAQEVRSGLGLDECHTLQHSADVLIPDWSLGKP